MENFLPLLVDCLAADLPMYPMRAEEPYLLFAGLWSTFWVNDANRGARVCLVTVLRPPGSPPVRGPVPLHTLVPWIVLQMHSVTEESPMWEEIRTALADEFAARDAQVEGRAGLAPTMAQRSLLQKDPSSENYVTRELQRPKPLASIAIEQKSTDSPKPVDVQELRRIEYVVPSIPGLRVFVEKPMPRQPLQRKLEANAGFVRSGSVLGAIHEWHTWFVATGTGPTAIAMPAPAGP